MDTKKTSQPGPDPALIQHNRYRPAHFDCETAVLLRSVLLPVFDQANSWSQLIDILTPKGYRLMFRQGILCITDTQTGARVCGLQFLGLQMRDLVARLGRPCVVVHPGSGADGDLLRHPPVRHTLH